jgi:hypothetical protein
MKWIEIKTPAANKGFRGMRRFVPAQTFVSVDRKLIRNPLYHKTHIIINNLNKT